MAVVTLQREISAGTKYTVTTDSSADWASVANSTYFFDKTDRLVYFKDGSGNVIAVFATTAAASSITVGTTTSVSGTDNRAFFQAGGVIQQDNNFTWDNTNKRLGIGNTAPSQSIEVQGGNILDWSFGTNPNIIQRRSNGTLASQTNVLSGEVIGYANFQAYQSAGLWPNVARVGATAEANQTNVSMPTRLTFWTTPTGSVTIQERMRIDQAGNVGIGGATTVGAKLDVRAQGTATTDIAFRVRNFANTQDIIRAYHNSNGDADVFIGEGAGNVTTGVENTFIGISSGLVNTTGFRNVGVGPFSLLDNTQGTLNTAVGYFALGRINNIGGNNVAVGASAGALINSAANNTNATNSVFIGAGTRANATGETNQIVIGNDARGLGSNTAVLGNSSTTITKVFGSLRLGTLAADPAGAVAGTIYYNTTTNLVRVFNGTAWANI